MRIKLTKKVVPWKLSRELNAAGVALLRDVAPILNDGLFLPLADESRSAELLPIIEAVIEAHDGVDDIKRKKVEAEAHIKNIPGWATWTEAEALDWFDANIGALNIPPEVKALLKAYGRLLLALRDTTWPRLGD